MHCLCVDPAQVHKVWPLVSHLVHDAMRKGGGDYSDVEKAVLAGERLLWIAADEQAIWAAAVTGLHIEHDGRKYCCIWACGGRERERWIMFKDELEKFGRDEGCQFMRVYGRRGWAKELPEYKLTQVILEKRLTDG